MAVVATVQLHMHPNGDEASLFDVEPTLAFAHGACRYETRSARDEQRLFFVCSYDASGALVCKTSMTRVGAHAVPVPHGPETLFAQPARAGVAPLVIGRRHYVEGKLHGREEVLVCLEHKLCSRRVALFTWHRGELHGEQFVYDADTGKLTGYYRMRHGRLHGWRYAMSAGRLMLYEYGALQTVLEQSGNCSLRKLRAMNASTD